MKLTDRIRNFFYAISHADQLIENNNSLQEQIINQAAELSKANEEYWKLNQAGIELTYERDSLQAQVDAFSSVLHTMTAQHPISPEKLYDCVRSHLDPDGDKLYASAQEITQTTDLDIYQSFSNEDNMGVFDRDDCDGFTMLRYLEMRHFGDLDGYIDQASKEYQQYRYKLFTTVIVKKLMLGKFLSANDGLILLDNHNERQNDTASLRRSDNLNDHSIPVGRIDYLGFNGKIRESLEYHNETDFRADIMQDNYCGVPMTLTVFSDPVTGKHIDTAWVQDMDPPPQGFSITPYQAPLEQIRQAAELPDLGANEPDWAYEP